MKIEISDLIAEVKENISCYEELGKKCADQWEKEFQLWLSGKSPSRKKLVKEEKGRLYFQIQDEEEVMEMADAYCDAVESGQVKGYWKDF